MSQQFTTKDTQTTKFEQVASSNQQTKSHGIIDELIAGTLAGWAQVISGHPFDTVKVKLQTQPTPPIYSGAIDCAKQLVQKEKLSGLYRGATSPLLGVGACNAVIFASNGFYRRQIAEINHRPSPEQLTLGEITLAGAMTGATVALINCPVELLKVQLQIQKDVVASGIAPVKQGLFSMGRSVLSSHGAIGLYRGFLPTILRDIPSYAGYFITYNGLKNFYMDWAAKNQKPLSLPTSLQILFGGLAGIACWVVCYPMDVVKSRIQASSIQSAPPTLSQAWASLQAEGGDQKSAFSKARPFLRGLAPTLARAFPANAATFVVYEAYIKFASSN